MLLAILKNYQDLSNVWLLTGEGEMLKKPASEEKHEQTETMSYSGKLIPFYDADAAAGLDYGTSMQPAQQVGMIEIGSPITGRDLL